MTLKKWFLIVFLMFFYASAHATTYLIETKMSACKAALTQSLIDAGYGCYDYPSAWYIGRAKPPAAAIATYSYGSTGVCPVNTSLNLTTGICSSVDPVCISPNVLNASAHVCYLPKECSYPETDNCNGICQNNTCPVGQNRNPLSKLCQTPPVCGSTETYDSASNTCKLYPLNCPGHSHANSANDACLPDAPLICPTGQHDDGTYKCVANDVNACKDNQQAGYINGVPPCTLR